MFKKVISIFAVLLFALSMSAQSMHFQKSGYVNNFTTKSLKGNLKSMLVLNENEKWIGYWDGDPKTELGMLGVQETPMNYTAAVKYPAGDAALKGAAIEGVKFPLFDYTNIDSVKIFMSTKLIASANEADICYQSIEKYKLTSVKNADNPFCEFRFDKPYVVDFSKDLFIGYEFWVTGGNSKAERFPIALVKNESGVYNSILMGFDGGVMSDLSNNDFGPLALQVLISSNLSSKLVLNENEYWTGYWNGDPKTELGMLGVQATPMNYTAAVKYPAGDAALKGATIEGVKFPLFDYTNIDSVKIFMSTKLIASAAEADICYQSIKKYKLTSVKNADNPFCEFRFDKPYVVDFSKDLFIGYEFWVTGGNSKAERFPIALVKNESGVDNSILMGFDGGVMSDLSNDDFGPLALQVLVSSDFAADAVLFDGELRNVNAVKGKKVSVPVSFVNKGTNACSSLKLRTTINGKSVESIYNLATPVSGIDTKFSVDVSFAVPETLDTYLYSIRVLQVNGVDIADDVTAAGNVKILSRNVKHKAFVEILTGFWCGWCPRCNVAGDKLKQVYGDDVLVAMVHDQDDLDCADYDAFVKKNLNFPSAIVNRDGKSIDPYYAEGEVDFAILDYVKDKMSDNAAVEVIPSVKFNTDSTDVTVDADIKFLFNGEFDYSVAYILIENKMSDNSWLQSNNYSKEIGGDKYDSLLELDPLWEPWVNGSAKVSDNENNYIVQAAQNIEFIGAYHRTVTADEVIKDSHVFNLEQYPKIRNIKNMEAIVLICDEATGEIMNACSVRLDGKNGAVENIHTDRAEAVEIARYTIDGRLITAPETGINIVKYSNGEVRKLIVR